MNTNTPHSPPPGPILLDNTKLRSKRRFKRRMRFILAFLFFAVALILIIFKDDIDFAEIRMLFTSQGSAFSAKSHDGTPLNMIFDFSGNIVSDSYKTNFVIASTRKLSVFRQDGTLARDMDIAMINPCIISGNRYFMLYDRGGSTIYIGNSISNIAKIQTEFPIITASINDKGEFAYVTGSKIYKTEVYVYDSDAHLSYVWYSQSSFINNASISPRGDNVAVFGISAQGADLTTSLKLIDIKSDSSSEEFIIGKDEVILKSTWRVNKLVIFTDKRLILYNIELNSIEKENILKNGPLDLVYAGKNDRYLAVFDDFQERGGSILEIYNDFAELIGTVELPKVPLKIYSANEKIIIIYTNSAEIYSKNGTLLKEIPDQIFKSVCINSNDQIYFVGIDNVYVYS